MKASKLTISNQTIGITMFEKRSTFAMLLTSRIAILIWNLTLISSGNPDIWNGNEINKMQTNSIRPLIESCCHLHKFCTLHVPSTTQFHIFYALLLVQCFRCFSKRELSNYPNLAIIVNSVHHFRLNSIKKKWWPWRTPFANRKLRCFQATLIHAFGGCYFDSERSVRKLHLTMWISPANDQRNQWAKGRKREERNDWNASFPIALFNQLILLYRNLLCLIGKQHMCFVAYK